MLVTINQTHMPPKGKLSRAELDARRIHAEQEAEADRIQRATDNRTKTGKRGGGAGVAFEPKKTSVATENDSRSTAKK